MPRPKAGFERQKLLYHGTGVSSVTKGCGSQGGETRAGIRYTLSPRRVVRARPSHRNIELWDGAEARRLFGVHAAAMRVRNAQPTSRPLPEAYCGSEALGSLLNMRTFRAFGPRSR